MTTGKHFSQLPIGRLSDSKGHIVNKFEHIQKAGRVQGWGEAGACGQTDMTENITLATSLAVGSYGHLAN